MTRIYLTIPDHGDRFARMWEKPLPPELLWEVLDCDFQSGILTWKQRPIWLGNSESAVKSFNKRYAGNVAFTHIGAQGYFCGNILRRRYTAHRVVWAMKNGRWPTMIDHKNGVKTDNSISNLEEVSPQENARNISIRSTNSSGATGVHWHHQCQAWTAQIGIAGRSCHIGNFKKKEDAIAARKKAEQEHGFHENHGRAK